MHFAFRKVQQWGQAFIRDIIDFQGIDREVEYCV